MLASRPRCRRHAHRHGRRLLPRPARHRPQRAADRPGARRLGRDRAECHRRHQGRRRPARRRAGTPTAARAPSRGVRALARARWASSGSISTSSTRPIPRVPFADSVGAMARAARGGEGPLDRAVQRLGGPDPRGPGASPRSPRCRTASIRSSGSRWRGGRAVLRGAGDRVSGVQPDGRRPARRASCPRIPCWRRSPRRLGVSAHAVVLAWVLAQSPAVLAIPSARTVEHALDSVAAADLMLSPDDLAAIDAAEFSRA